MHLLFDLDGTLTDPFVGITTCIRHALLSLGRPAPPADELRWCIGPPLKQSLAALLGPGHSHLTDEALALYRERFGSVGLFENERYPDVPGVLASLQAEGYTLRVATSKPAVYARRIVDHFGLSGFFEAVDGSELDGRHVNKGDLIAHVLAGRRLAPAGVLMIGDREHDVAGARANGVEALGVLWGYGSREELERAGALACAATPGELLALVRQVRPLSGPEEPGRSEAVGLETGVVRVVDYDPRWPAVFVAEAARLTASAAGLPLRLEHIGSTSVPGLCAKPIVDIAAGRPSGSALAPYVAAFEAAGYEHRGTLGVAGREYFCRGVPRQFHLHLVEDGGALWRSHLGFRDRLRRHPGEALTYAALKRDLAARFPNDRQGYTEAKSAFVEDILARAALQGTSGHVSPSGPDDEHTRPD